MTGQAVRHPFQYFRLMLCVAFLVAWFAGAQRIHAADLSHENLLKAFKQKEDAQPSERLAEVIGEKLAALTDGKKPDARQFIELAAWHRFYTLFYRQKLTDAQVETIETVARDRRMFATLMLAIGEKDDPQQVLAVAKTLLASRVDHTQAPDLFAAFCIVWDKPVETKADAASEQKRMVGLYEYFAQPSQSQRQDPRKLPWPLLTMLADTRSSVEELKWAASQYTNWKEKIGKVFFDVRYDKAGLYYGDWQGIQGKPYTLENILDKGGVCKDQAYYATEVCRALKIPAINCQGRSGRGVGYHCWLGYLDTSDGKPTFNFTTGRYEEHHFWSALIVDPQSRENWSDGDAMLLAELAGVSLDHHLLSRAIERSIDLAPAENRAELLKQAIEFAPGNRDAWLKLADALSQDQPDGQALNGLIAAIQRFAINRYDEFGYELFVRMIQGYEPRAKLNLMQRASRMFSHRPDLVARSQIEMGKIFVEMDLADRALRTWSNLAARSASQPPIVLDAMDQIDKTLTQQGKTEELAVYLANTWQRMNVPKPSGYVWTTPWYLVGSRYSEVLVALDRQEEAAKVQALLDSRDTRPEDVKRKAEAAGKP